MVGTNHLQTIRVVGKLKNKGRYRPKMEILVKGACAPREDATWENPQRFVKLYPNFFLVDKENLRVGE